MKAGSILRGSPLRGERLRMTETLFVGWLEHKPIIRSAGKATLAERPARPFTTLLLLPVALFAALN